MRMPSVQFTVRGMMVAVAVIALDFFVLIMTDGGAGVLLIGPLLNVGFVRWWRTQGRRRRFWGGFVAAGLGAVLAYIGCVQALGPADLWPWFIINSTLPYLPLRAAEWFEDIYDAPNNLIFMITMFEVAFGLPMLLFAFIGGRLSAFTWPRKVPHSNAVLSASAET
jgi:hypothetical protein